MKAPDTIYLQRHDNQNDDFAWVWCRDKINDEDVEYVRAGSGEPVAWAWVYDGRIIGTSPNESMRSVWEKVSAQNPDEDAKVVPLYTAPPDTKALVEALERVCMLASGGVESYEGTLDKIDNVARTALAQQGDEE